MARRALALLACAVAAYASSSTTFASAAECTEPPYTEFYTTVQQQIRACRNIIGFNVANPLTDEQRTQLCHKCDALAVATVGKRFGNCTVVDPASGATMMLQAQMDQIFVCNDVVMPSSSGSGFDGIIIDNDTATSAPSLGSQAGSNSTIDSGSQAASAAADTHHEGSSISIKAVIGIAVIGVALVVIVASLIICRQRRRTKDILTKFEQTMPITPSASSSTPVMETGFVSAASSFGIIINNKSGSSSDNSSQLSQLLLQSGYSGVGGGLWDDQVIVAARIPREKVVSRELISRGGFGEVYLGTYNSHAVAIKTLLPESRRDMKQIHAFLAEVKLMATLEHERIVRFIGVAWDSLTDLCVVSEYVEGGDLRTVLSRFEDVEHRPHGFDHDKVKIALHISHALTYLHSLEQIVLHRDLKSKNILLDNELNAKLTDFGVSRERSDRTMTAGVGTSLWMAPEVMLGERYDQKADMFSFGVVLSELDSHRVPYAQAKEAQSGHRIPDTAILQMVSIGKLRVQFSSNALPEMVELANACVSLNPDERPTAADMLCRLHNLLKRKF